MLGNFEKCSYNLLNSQGILDKMSGEVFERHRAALEGVNGDSRETTHDGGKRSLLCGQILCGRYNFREQELQLDELKKVTLDGTRAVFRVFRWEQELVRVLASVSLTNLLNNAWLLVTGAGRTGEDETIGRAHSLDGRGWSWCSNQTSQPRGS
jgi:hypothetical protein